MKRKTLTDYKQRMERVLNHIGSHLDDTLSLDELAAQACFSPYHFHRVFTGMIGETVKDYVRRLRLERAAQCLQQKNSTVTMVAFDAGYDSPEAFARAFHTVFGCSPSQYRSEVRSIHSSLSGVHFSDGTIRHFRSHRRNKAMQVSIKHLAAQRVAFVSHLGPYENVGQAWSILCTGLGRHGYLGGDTALFGICYDDPAVTPPDKIRYDACATISADFIPTAEIGVKWVEGGDFAVTTHKGPYHEVGKVYAALYGQWLPRSGREMRNAPALEFYLNDPNSTEPRELLTDIYAPLLPQVSLPEVV